MWVRPKLAIIINHAFYDIHPSLKKRNRCGIEALNAWYHTPTRVTMSRRNKLREIVLAIRTPHIFFLQILFLYSEKPGEKFNLGGCV